MIESLLLKTITDLLLTAFQAVKLRSRTTNFDFLIEDRTGKRIAIEVYGEPLSEKRISQLLERVTLAKDLLDQFVVVTPDPPSDMHLNSFSAAFQGLNSHIHGSA